MKAAEKPTRDQIIAALRRFDEGFTTEDVLDSVSTEDLYKRLDNLSRVFFAEDLILAAKLGF